jgi:hypothetical protein
MQDLVRGLEETEASIANKLSRGTFPATFFPAALIAIGVEAVKLEDVQGEARGSPCQLSPF